MNGREGFVCPRCRCGDLERSAVRWYERPRKIISRARPYRCHRCRHRTWRRASTRNPPDDTTPDAVSNTTDLQTWRSGDSVNFAGSKMTATSKGSTERLVTVEQGRGYLVFNSRVALPVKYELRTDEQGRTTGRVVGPDEITLKRHLGSATLTLADGRIWECILAGHDGRLVDGQSPLPARES